MLAGAGMRVSGAATLGARFDAASGWQPVRAARGLKVDALAPTFDVPLPGDADSTVVSTDPLSLRTTLTATVSASILDGWKFDAR